MIKVQKLSLLSLVFTLITNLHAQHVRFKEPAINTPDTDGKTPLHWAVIQGNQEKTITLLDKGANVHARDNKQNTPSYYAEQQGYVQLSRILYDHGARSRWVHLPPK